MGKHTNADAGSDEAADELDGEEVPHETARHVADAGHPLEAQAVISADTHVGVDTEVAADTPDAPASPANPDALIEHGLVGDGHELE
jgi:hypothetical protein